MDQIDKIIEQWTAERPDLDVAPMALIGRIKRLSQHLSNEMGKTFAQHGLNIASFDVLATLLRSGAPYQLSPNDLLATMMITSGTMTNRIDQLVKSGWVERINNPQDKRSVFIALTNKGFDTIEAAVTDHVATQHRLVKEIPADDFNQMNSLLSNFLSSTEPDK
jgi:DNA-binding MarR family transcriptional regulator